MTIYCYDTEFLEDGKTIELISIGIVCEDGREYYAVNSDCNWERIRKHDWLWENVVPHLPTVTASDDGVWLGPPTTAAETQLLTKLDTTNVAVKPKWVIANEVHDFLVGHLKPFGAKDGKPFYVMEEMPELWAYFGAYDHVALCQLWGTMMGLPNLIPMWTHDLNQLTERIPGFKKPAHEGDAHNALADAKWLYDALCAAKAALG